MVQPRTIITLDEISQRTGIPLATLRWYRHRGTGGPPTFRLGRRVVAYADEVDTWVGQARARDPLGTHLMAEPFAVRPEWAEAVRAHVDRAEPLTPEQIDRLAVLLRQCPVKETEDRETA